MALNKLCTFYVTIVEFYLREYSARKVQMSEMIRRVGVVTQGRTLKPDLNMFNEMYFVTDSREFLLRVASTV